MEQAQNKGDYFLEVLIEGVQVSNIKESYFNSDTFSGLIHKSEDFALDWVIRKNRLKELKRVTNLYLDAHQQAKYYIRKLRTEIDDEELIALYILTFLFQDPKPKQQILEIRDPIKRINKIKDLLSILYLKQVDLEHLDPS